MCHKLKTVPNKNVRTVKWFKYVVLYRAATDFNKKMYISKP